MGGRIVEGRSFTNADRATTMPVLIVSAAFARLAWPGEQAIGKRLQVAAQDRGPDAQPVFRTIVGVAADMRYRSLEAPTPTIYAPFAQSPDRIADFMIRAGVEPAALAPAIRQRMRALNGNGSVTIDVMDDVVSRLETPWRSNFSLFVLLAGLTMTIAAAGLYALMAWSVTATGARDRRPAGAGRHARTNRHGDRRRWRADHRWRSGGWRRGRRSGDATDAIAAVRREPAGSCGALRGAGAARHRRTRGDGAAGRPGIAN